MEIVMLTKSVIAAGMIVVAAPMIANANVAQMTNTAANPAAVHVSAGDVQLARQAGVKPGLYTSAELVRIIQDRRDNDQNDLNFVLSHLSRRTNIEGLGVVTPGKAQMAAEAGVNPSKYTLAQIEQLDNAIETR
jgi:hypothetical protein